MPPAVESSTKGRRNRADERNKPFDPEHKPYYFEGGLRRVKPYFYTYNTFCKERWRGRELADIFVSEFRDRSPEYYVRQSLKFLRLLTY